MLSRPPAWLAASISAWPASGSVLAARRMSATWDSGTIEVSPSLQSRKTSPATPRQERVSTTTSGSGPSARVMIERCGCSSASWAVSWPRRRISSTSEWSSVRRVNSSPRRRYARESPTWAIATSCSPTCAAVIVVPIPARLIASCDIS